MKDPADLVDEPTRELARFVADLRLDSIPAAVVEHAKDLLLDSFACALAADYGEETSLLNKVLDTIGGGGDSTVVGDRQTRDMKSAVLLNGFRITAVTACDVYAPADLHTTPEIVPPILAVAEQKESTGTDVLVAAIAGFESVVRLARAFDYPQFRSRGWHSPGVVGPLGAAAATASILKMGPEATMNALAVAGSTAGGTWAAGGSPTVKFHQARAGLTGFMAAMLANSGFTGSDAILTHQDGGFFVAYASGDPDAVVTDLGHDWELERISLRRWPGGARLQPSMAAVSRIIDDSKVRWEDVSSVVVKVAPEIAAKQAWAAKPKGTFAALASIPYAVAVILRYGSVVPKHFTSEFYGDPDMVSFLDDRIEVEGEAEIPALGAAVEVTTQDGQVLSASVETPKGHPRSPASRDEMLAKVEECAPTNMTPASVDELIERVLGIENEENMSRILELVRP